MRNMVELISRKDLNIVITVLTPTGGTWSGLDMDSRDNWRM